MGLGTQMIGWPDAFCEQLAGRGFYVIRYDNRDIGRSTHLRQFRPPTLRQLLLRDKRAAHYSLADMADDGIGLLDRARDRARARRRRLDGRHDRPDDGGPAPGPGALARLDHVQHRASAGRARPAWRIYPLLRPPPRDATRDAAIESTLSDVPR